MTATGRERTSSNGSPRPIADIPSIIDGRNNGLRENRSNAFSAVATTVPEPGSLGLITIGLLASVLGIRRRPR